jgi:hypothetical protein
VSILENVRFYNQIFANDALYRIAPAVDYRLQVLDNNGRKCPRHGPSINRESPNAKEQISQLIRDYFEGCRPQTPPESFSGLGGGGCQRFVTREIASKKAFPRLPDCPTQVIPRCAVARGQAR